MYAILLLIATLLMGFNTLQAGQVDYAEPHLTNIKQLTFGGENAEAYFSYDGSELIFQSTRGELGCDS